MKDSDMFLPKKKLFLTFYWKSALSNSRHIGLGSQAFWCTRINF